jgi:hypothetical protein
MIEEKNFDNLTGKQKLKTLILGLANQKVS